MAGIKPSVFPASSEGAVFTDTWFPIQQPGNGASPTDCKVSGEWLALFIAGQLFFDSYDDDDGAATGGVPIGGIYFLTGTNPYGMVEGVPKKRIA